MGTKGTVLYNTILILTATLTGALFPKIGTILGFLGGFIGLVLMYIIPIAVFLKRYELQLFNERLPDLPNEGTLLESEQDYLITSRMAISLSPKVASLNRSSQIISEKDEEESTLSQQANSESSLICKYLQFFMVLFFHCMIILVGVIVVLLQFVTF